MYRLVAAMFVLALVQAPAIAWSEETNAFRGVELGVRISEAYPECPKDLGPRGGGRYLSELEGTYPVEKKGIACYRRLSLKSPLPGAELFEVANLTFVLGMGATVQVTAFDDRVHRIEARFLSSHNTALYAGMVDRFGAPGRLDLRTFRNRLGHVFEGRSARWYGKAVTLSYDEFAFDADWGSASLASAEYDRRASEWYERRRNEVKSGL